MKNKLAFLLAIVGGIIGFLLHKKWHLARNLKLSTFSPHIILGIVSVLIGIVLGLLLWKILNKIWNK